MWQYMTSTWFEAEHWSNDDGPDALQAAYHAVPLVGIPLIADQLDNVMKAVHRGFGLAVSPKGGLKAKTIGTALNRVLTEPGFKKAAVKLSIRLRSRTRTPAQEAAGACHIFFNASVMCMHTSSLSSFQQTVAMYQNEGIWIGMGAA